MLRIFPISNGRAVSATSQRLVENSDIIRNHKISKGSKIGHSSGEVFKKLMNSPIGESQAIWIIPEHIIEVDFETLNNSTDLDESIIKLASKKCIKDKPFIVSTKKNLEQEGANFTILTPKEATDMYHNPNSRFN